MARDVSPAFDKSGPPKGKKFILPPLGVGFGFGFGAGTLIHFEIRRLLEDPPAIAITFAVLFIYPTLPTTIV